MKEIGAFEAKTKFGQLLDQVEAGDEILITRRGRVVARLVPSHPGHDKAAAAALVEKIRARRQSVTLSGAKIKDLIAEGRR